MYVSSTRKIISSYNAVFDESLSIELAYTSRPNSEAMAIRPSIMYTPCATPLRGETGNIITFEKFKEGGFMI